MAVTLVDRMAVTLVGRIATVLTTLMHTIRYREITSIIIWMLNPITLTIQWIIHWTTNKITINITNNRQQSSIIYKKVKSACMETKLLSIQHLYIPPHSTETRTPNQTWLTIMDRWLHKIKHNKIFRQMWQDLKSVIPGTLDKYPKEKEDAAALSFERTYSKTCQQRRN